MFWGMYFGIFMIIEKWLKTILEKLPLFIRHTYTVILIIFSWSIFYFTDLGKLKAFVINLFHSERSINPQLYTDLAEHSFWLIIVVALCIPWDEIFPNGSIVYQRTAKVYKYLTPVLSLTMLFLSTAMLVGSTYNPFIYFRF